ncbi:hypothetical protein DN39_3324 [Vibrio cholerae]|nr:hypothetical protein DN39_3324 [Vibrio cholerae]
MATRAAKAKKNSAQRVINRVVELTFPTDRINMAPSFTQRTSKCSEQKFGR